MADLLKHQARICQIAAGMMIHDQKVLLVKHKKLKRWLSPGGHIDPGELPHQAAEREFFEETGVRGRAVDYLLQADSEFDQYLPSPIETNLHWVCQENYQHRIESNDPSQPVKTELWPRGCEQHLCFVYLLKPLNNQLEPKLNSKETTDIGWFTQQELNSIELTPELRGELEHGFYIIQRYSSQPLFSF